MIPIFFVQKRFQLASLYRIEKTANNRGLIIRFTLLAKISTIFYSAGGVSVVGASLAGASVAGAVAGAEVSAVPKLLKSEVFSE